MSHLPNDTQRTFHPAVVQRHLEAEVAHCVGGVITPPCGVPVTCLRTTPSLITPARSITRSSLSTDWSQTRSSIVCINRSCGIASKQEQ